jgi:hypothetical protein
MMLVGTVGLAAENLPFQLRGSGGCLTVDAKGLSLAPAVAGCPPSVATGEAWWTVVLEAAPGKSGGDVALGNLTQPAPRVKRMRDGVRLIYDGPLSDGKKTYGLSLELTFRTVAGAFEFGGELHNDTKDWVVRSFTGPVLNGLQTELARTPLLLPCGFGYRFCGAPKEGKKKTWDEVVWRKAGNGLGIFTGYPSAGGTMQWFAFAGEMAGLYFGSCDPRCGNKVLNPRYDPVRKTFEATFLHNVYIHPGERFVLPPTRVEPYAGDWHVAARTYRAWVDSVGKQIEKPAWAKTATGWLLAILKQQNGEIIWPYTSMDKLCDVADAHGLDMIGLFGWGYGGHDHLYPDYDPCPLMGGEKALRQGIKLAHARGKRVILYANGQLEERGTAFWTTTGQHLAVTLRDGRTEQEFWHKYSNTPGYHFDIGCQATQGWRERMLSLALQANDFGADGILYDQLGGRGPTPCYAADHGHPVPFMSYEADRKEMLRQIADRMKKANPDFILMTEGFHDSILDSITYFHGCVSGAFQGSAQNVAQRLAEEAPTDGLFPELMRYTYPEVESTIRFPSPLVDRPMANYTLAYGLRYEIESRYMPDRTYLLEGRIPAVEDYGLVREKPSIDLVRTLPREETATYLKNAAAFQKKHADLLMVGRFTDTEGFTFNGDKGVLAKGFENGQTFGVLVWNTGNAPAAVRVTVPGADLVSASEPGNESVEAQAPLAPQSVRLSVWKKK